MVKLNTIYTRTGDAGETGLVGGARVGKHHPRIQAVGSVDEANCAIGLISSVEYGESLRRIQQDLFDLGADLATPGVAKQDLRIVAAQVERLEREIDAMNEGLAPLASFVLPGGMPAAAQAHLARAVVRRAERDMRQLADIEPVNPAALQYINRLSDHLFVLARVLNDHGAQDVLWQPGINR